MNKREIVAIALISIIGTGMLLSAIIIPIYFNKSFPFGIHDEQHTTVILIENPEDFTKNGFTGSGSLEDPFILTNKKIDTNKDCAIAIIDAYSHFIIRDCVLIAKEYGIFINNHFRKSFEISNNEITIKKNKVDQFPPTCIAIYNSNFLDITITNNVLSGCDFSDSIGLKINYGTNLTVHNNTFLDLGSGFNFYQTGLISIRENTFTDCLNEIYDCYHITIENNNFSNVEYNQLLSLIDVDVILISDNSFNGGGDSIFAWDCFKVDVSYNFFNSKLAISFQEVINSSIHHNNFFLYNTYYSGMQSQATDDNETNTWYDISINEGNYWSDLIWDDGISYEISGTANNTDPYPLEFPLNF